MHNISLLVCNYKRTCVNNNELKMKMKRRVKSVFLSNEPLVCVLCFYVWAFCAFTWALSDFTWAFFERKAVSIPKESDPKIR